MIYDVSEGPTVMRDLSLQGTLDDVDRTGKDQLSRSPGTPSQADVAMPRGSVLGQETYRAAVHAENDGVHPAVRKHWVRQATEKSTYLRKRKKAKR